MRHLCTYSRATLRPLVDWLLPARCIFCAYEKPAVANAVCSGCLDDLPWINQSCCRCAEPLGPHESGDCARCQDQPPPFRLAAAPFRYAFPIDAAVRGLKYHRRLYYAPFLAKAISDAVAERGINVDAVLAVPLHWRRQARRGYNQASELARGVARHTGLPMLDARVTRRRTLPQSGLSASHRRANLRNAFSVNGLRGGLRVLIIDDVITTTATCSQLARALLDAGAGEISVAAIARATTLD